MDRNSKISLSVESTEPKPSSSKYFYILVVNDDPDRDEIIQGMLKGYKCRAHYESTAAAFVSLHHMNAKPDLVISDVDASPSVLPKNNELFKLPVFLISSDVNEKFVLESSSSDVALYIVERSNENDSLLRNLVFALPKCISSVTQNLKRKESEQAESSRNKRIPNWTKGLDGKLRRTIKQPEDHGNQRVVPGNSLGLMNFPSLDARPVASPLQTYSAYHPNQPHRGMQNANWTSNVNALRFPSANPITNLSGPQGNLQYPFQTQRPYWNQIPPAGCSSAIPGTAYAANMSNTKAMRWRNQERPPLPSLGNASTTNYAASQNIINYLNFGTVQYDTQYGHLDTHSGRIVSGIGSGWQFGKADMVPNSAQNAGTTVGHGQYLHNNEMVGQNFTSLQTPLRQEESLAVSRADHDTEIPAVNRMDIPDKPPGESSNRERFIPSDNESGS